MNHQSKLCQKRQRPPRKNDGRELHGCPYQKEINDSKDEEYCNCCKQCTEECLWDI